MDRLFGFLKSLGSGRSMAIIGIAIGIAATLGWTILRAGSSQMDLLYANVQPAEAGEMISVLEQAGIRAQAVGDGSLINVQRGKVFEARNILIQRNLPSSGSVGYEIFDENNTMGQTQFVQDINRQRALEGELARTINEIDGINYARVQLVLPERRLFQDDAAAPTAAVVVGYVRQPTAAEIAGIQTFVANASPVGRAERVVVTDKRSGRTLAGGESDANGALAANERRGEVEQELERKLQRQLEPIVGAGRVRATVNAELNLARVTTQQETFDPDGQVVRSSQMSENTSENGQGMPGGEATVGANLPDGGGGIGMTEQSSTLGSSEITNFEISKTVRTEVTEPGSINRLTVAVAVDGVRGPAGENGAPGEWAPRSEEDMAKILDLVHQAVGYNEERGDEVTVTQIQFPGDAALDGGVEVQDGLLSGFGKNDIMRAAELFVLLLVAALTVFFVARPLLKGIGSGGGEGGGMAMPMLAGAGAGGGQVLAGPSGPMSAQLPYEKASGSGQGSAQQQDNMIDIARIEGQVKASAVKQVSDFADRHPEESVSILRSWLHEG